MKAFMDQDFLLETETARRLYHDYAAKMPIVDYHCHINPQEIAENKRYETITELMLGGDHYKWRAMRWTGAEESFVTGNAGPEEKFVKWAQALEKAVGNPLYHWTHLELQRYFGITEPLTAQNAGKIYRKCNEKLAQPEMSVRGIIEQSNVKLICTTDDPADDLRWHKQIAEDASCKVKALPAFRPDKAMGVEKPGYDAYICTLEAAAGSHIDSFGALCQALDQRIDYFNSMGCRAADHGLDHMVFDDTASENELTTILRKALLNEEVTTAEADAFKTAVLVHLSKKYRTYDWVMQIHFGCLRNNNAHTFRKLGPDTGFDAINSVANAERLSRLLDTMERQKTLPKTVLYSLNPNDNEVIMALAGCFQESGIAGKVQLGAAWWFNDTKSGMLRQLETYANIGVLGEFIGMLTDSRSFLSYTRHEYFRRILCNFLGNLAENGEYPSDLAVLGGMAENISFHNTVKYFGFSL